jgi:hypothetical protein
MYFFIFLSNQIAQVIYVYRLFVLKKKSYIQVKRMKKIREKYKNIVEISAR